MERFESRLAASLEQLADEVPTSVSGTRLAREIAAADAGRGWPERLREAWDRTLAPLGGLAPVFRYALAPAFLLILAAGLFALAQRTEPVPFADPVVGQMTCEGPTWTTSSRAVEALACSAELRDPRLSGTVRLDVDAAEAAAGVRVRSGTIELRTASGTWHGDVGLTVGANGMAIGDAVLAGSADDSGLVLGLHLITSDGRTWGLMASVEVEP